MKNRSGAGIAKTLLATAIALSFQLGLHRAAGAEVTPASTANHNRRGAQSGPRCPWVGASRRRHASPLQLADEVLSRMSLGEKAGFVVLRAKGPYENVNTAVPSLCLPELVLSDGPNGIAYLSKGVTQLPASLAVAASFDPALAYDYGRVLGQEARGKGIDVVQGPNLNLVRVPESGRAFEGFGEDPYLVSVMGVADIEGIQSTRTMSDAKHFTAYNQETARSLLDEQVSRRALEELYLVPFEAAVEQAHVASIMCSYGSLNGVNDCSNRELFSILYRQWRFTGFVRSDLRAVRSLDGAFDAGLSMIKPAKAAAVVAGVDKRQLSVTALNNAVRRVLGEMFRYGLIGGRPMGRADAYVATPAHRALALSAAEESMVLLKDSGGLLPLGGASASVAVIGTDADNQAATAGHGSAAVIAPFVITPLRAITALLGKSRVSYAPGGPSGTLPPVPLADYRSGSPLPVFPLLPSRPERTGHEPGKSDIRIASLPGITREDETAEHPLSSGAEWSSWAATLIPPRTGLYEISLTESGDCWLRINGATVMAFPGLHGRVTWDTAVNLEGAHPYRFQLNWLQLGHSYPYLGWEDVTPALQRAVAEARKADVAVVFASDFNSEAFDRPNLDLPGAENQLISAVAAANRHTVVVLNTGGAVLMPWLGKVSAVLEAWYPGEEDGAATAAVLFGRIDPSGRLPITFPASNSQVPTSTTRQWPGVDGVVDYSEGLEIGYRWYQAQGIQPLFPFGFGLSYTTFQLGEPHLQTIDGTDRITLAVTNTGKRAGAEVVQCYLQFPWGSGEPPHQLRAFSRVELLPGQTKQVALVIGRSSFEDYSNGRFEVPAGNFNAWVGVSSQDLAHRLAVRPPQ